MSDAERTALLQYHAAEIQRLLADKPKEKKVLIDVSMEQVRANRLKNFKIKN